MAGRARVSDGPFDCMPQCSATTRLGEPCRARQMRLAAAHLSGDLVGQTGLIGSWLPVGVDGSSLLGILVCHCRHKRLCAEAARAKAEPDSAGILFFDELNAAPPLVHGSRRCLAAGLRAHSNRLAEVAGRSSRCVEAKCSRRKAICAHSPTKPRDPLCGDTSGRSVVDD